MSVRTEVWPADDPAAIARAAEVLRRGGLVAFPTETVYGLGADALDAAAVRRIFAAKGRPADNPLIVHVAAPEQARALARAVPPAAETLMSLWPGPLTLVLPRAAVVPDVTTAGQDTVAVRIPKHPAALALLRACGRPVAAPSANRSGRPSPTTAEHVHADLDGVVDVILDGGPCAVGLESTVVDVTRATPMVLRAGGLSLEALRSVVGAVDVLSGQDHEAMSRSPGLRHRHYAPRARVVLVAPGQAAARGGEAVAVMSQSPCPPGFVGRWRLMPGDLEGYAQALFGALRELDAPGVETIVVETVPEVGLGRAITDRLRRAAEG
ncbi:L-threonylcarbamoyladenylate synthase [Nannocystis radixulma]|uniref:Threonylcarbamoyl-AMP synthase n=1 Tax=Nannocystis radixulma TaxID=2995305 RepID=A0ABT5BMR7_9BACT|nr:L-threonylcarbamoyladenylate synthase [Nannocystis radixulma]MDC0675454.1 L-threonylcarbamoyladenylate synthase [Nannocystis radixulma]MDC0675467.1 L-threonylcarbamoyladenylate synthase [Nannocystis radixulma]